MSAHINSNAHFAKTVLMPGDPLRAKYIAENYLVDAELVTDIRGILGYTGKTKDGREISVMASGMGCPSIGIYSYELFAFYGVEQIIRIGTAGSYQKDIHVGDVVLGMSSSSTSNYGEQIKVKNADMAPCCDFNLLLKAYNNANSMGLKVHVGPIFSSDVFYDEDEAMSKRLQELGLLCVEMEAYALYINAWILHKKALCILTISDSLSGEKEKELTPKERETMLNDMFKLGLTLAD